ncbi:type II toxin-antitoxin system RelE/ParE family toxin [Flavobacterium cellulosilyticum]|uniref:Type II toxin-antitoxin system RelE/ParE family toxin n=1 Tax=Flavobacterium cellulosilyticum TaxID=2541731 RepID=A0A4R5CCV8_9FLAO|nr:type II toxin-antitoxin system RelE/ParE family toxin [Flavobacterium cellulosilyticum]TDD97295.1 type II toxin-antitoxin system RelE/ParE family toxin [Flavobacterium cellulosilyticum]
MQKPIKILWDNKAKSDLKLIFELIKLKSPQGAKNVLRDIVLQSKNIHFVEQYQVDEFLEEPYRRIIVRNYKIIYKIHSETEIRILQIFDTRQNPIKLNKQNE